MFSTKINLLFLLTLVSFETSSNCGAINVITDGSVLDEKSSFKIMGHIFSFKLDWCCYTVNIGKTAPKKILSSEIVPYLSKSIIRPGMECLGWCSKLLLGYVG